MSGNESWARLAGGSGLGNPEVAGRSEGRHLGRLRALGLYRHLGRERL